MSQIAHDTHGLGEHGDHSPHLAHHFHSLGQQFSSGKLGMWLFLATEVLLFGGLFCAYAVYRSLHPEIFVIGSKATDWRLGATNTVVLILSSVTMAWGVTAAQKGQQTLLKILLVLTILGGCGFMGIKYVEYKHKLEHGLAWAGAYDPHHEPTAERPAFTDEPAAGTEEGAEEEAIEALAPAGAVTEEGTIPRTGARDPDLERGLIGEADPDIPPATSPEGEIMTGGVLAAMTGEEMPEASASTAAARYLAYTGWNEYQFADVPVDRSQVLPAPRGPAGMIEAESYLNPEHEPKLVQVYFSIYFGMTGLHGLHVLVGMAVIGWLLVRTFKGDFGPDYFTPVDLGGLYWHLVDLIWIFLFPLLYLI